MSTAVAIYHLLSKIKNKRKLYGETIFDGTWNELNSILGYDGGNIILENTSQHIFNSNFMGLKKKTSMDDKSLRWVWQCGSLYILLPFVRIKYLFTKRLRSSSQKKFFVCSSEHHKLKTCALNRLYEFITLCTFKGF